MKRRILGLLTAFALVVSLLAGADSAASGVASASVVPSTWCDALAARSPVVDILGDSVSAGDSVSDVSLRHHAMLGDSLRGDGATGTQIWTGGAIPGSATADYVSGGRYAAHIEFTAHHPDLIFLGWGINDWAGSIPISTFRDQYQQIISRIRELSPDSILVLIHMPWVYNTDLLATRGDQADYRDVIRSLAAINHTGYLGLEWFYRGDDLHQLSTPDRVHLNARGQLVQYAAERSFILGLCGGR